MPEINNHRHDKTAAQEKNLRVVGERIDGLLEEFATVRDSRAREKAEELVRLLMELYGGALAKVLEIVVAGGRADEIVERLGADELLSGLLVLHGLHPLDAKERITRALDRVRPYLGSHGGDVKLLRIKDGVAYLSLEGSCHGCPSSALTMKLAVEKAIEEAAPEVARIEVEGVSQAVASVSVASGDPHNGERNPRDFHSAKWFVLDNLPEFAQGDLASTELGGINILVCRLDGTFYAYRDRCPSCGLALKKSPLRENILTCSSCGNRFDVRRAGQCLDAEELDMAPLPLLIEDDGVKIAVAT